MPPLNKRYLLFSMLSGAVWGWIGYFLGARWIGPAIWGALLLSPLIGLLVGIAFRWWYRLHVGLKVLVALLALYCSAIVFGLAVGVSDVIYDEIRQENRRIPLAVIQQSVLGVPWGITFTGFFVVLWPLTLLNFYLLGRFSRTGGEAEAPAPPR